VKLIVGLGNPGRTYANSKHNIGFAVVKALAKFYKIPLKKDNFTFSLSGKGRIEGQNIALVLPLTFMNLSGIALGVLIKKYKTGLDNILVICDDLDLEFGRLKIRPQGSSGGHRGLQSIIDTLERQDFCRLRIGIGRTDKNMASAEYVLSPFNKGEKKEVPDIIEKAIECSLAWITKGPQASMNIFNRRSR